MIIAFISTEYETKSKEVFLLTRAAAYESSSSHVGDLCPPVAEHFRIRYVHDHIQNTPHYFVYSVQVNR